MDHIIVEGQITVEQLSQWIILLNNYTTPLIVYIHKAYGAKGINDVKHISSQFINQYACFINSLQHTKRYLIIISSGYVLGGSMAWVLSANVHYSLENTKFGFPEINNNELPILVSVLLKSKNHCIRPWNHFFATGDYLSTTRAKELHILDSVFQSKKELEDQLFILTTNIKDCFHILLNLPFPSIEQGIEYYNNK